MITMIYNKITIPVNIKLIQVTSLQLKLVLLVFIAVDYVMFYSGTVFFLFNRVCGGFQCCHLEPSVTFCQVEKLDPVCSSVNISLVCSWITLLTVDTL